MTSARLGVITDWKHGPRLLTYRQTERTFGLVTHSPRPASRTGCPPARCRASATPCSRRSIPAQLTGTSTSLAVDWTDLDSFSRPPPRGTSDCADPEASWGGRDNLLRSQDELYWGWYLSAGIMVPEENGPAVPEFARRATVSSCRHNPVRAFAPVLTAMPAAQASRSATSWMIPATPTAKPVPGHCRFRQAGAQDVQDLHPHDRGPKGTHDGAIIANGNLYCPRHAAPAAGTRAAGPHRHQRAGRGPRPQDRRAGPATSSAASPPTTPTATTGCSAPPSWARSAARCGPRR